MDSAERQKDVLHHYLVQERGSLLAKVEGLDEYDLRRPLTPTATRILGVVKHVASVQLCYLGVVFDRPSGRDPLPWYQPGAGPDGDMYVTEQESRAEILDLWGFSAQHADETVRALDLSAPGLVPSWPPPLRRVTLHTVLVHLLAEVARHAGHVDILREGLDSTVGLRPGASNLPDRTAQEWVEYRGRVEAAARAVSTRPLR